MSLWNILSDCLHVHLKIYCLNFKKIISGLVYHQDLKKMQAALLYSECNLNEANWACSSSESTSRVHLPPTSLSLICHQYGKLNAGCKINVKWKLPSEVNLIFNSRLYFLLCLSFMMKCLHKVKFSVRVNWICRL